MLEQVTWQDGAMAAGILIALVVVSVWFNGWIDAFLDNDPLGGYNAVFTVLGVVYTLIGAGLVVGLLFGWQIALIAVGSVLVCFMASGVPMWLGDMRRAARQRKLHMAESRLGEE
jgi:hypothetical protein